MSEPEGKPDGAPVAALETCGLIVLYSAILLGIVGLRAMFGG